MEALAVLDIADKNEVPSGNGRPEHEITLGRKFNWFQTDECKALRWLEIDTQGETLNKVSSGWI